MLKAPRSIAPAQRVAEKAVRGVSWMSILAAATLGVAGVDQVRARISSGSEHLEADGEMRLIVQAYRRDNLIIGDLPEQYAQPLASTQRAITAEELRNGVDVNLVQLGDDVAVSDDSVIVAWVERGSANLDYDGMEARPARGAFYGTSPTATGEIVLRLARS